MLTFGLHTNDLSHGCELNHYLVLIDIFVRLADPNAQKSVPDVGSTHIFIKKAVLNTHLPVENLHQSLLFTPKIA